MTGTVEQPPIQLYSLEGRYAHALFSAASKKDTLSAVEKEVGSLKVRGLTAASQVSPTLLSLRSTTQTRNSA